MIVFNITILYHYNFDHCGHDSKLFDFCCKYWNYVKKGQLLKFSISNKMLQLYY